MQPKQNYKLNADKTITLIEYQLTTLMQQIMFC